MIQAVGGNFAKSLLAVVVGNLIYFVVMPWLPPAARHAVPRNGSYPLDLGLVIDFWVCVVVYGVIELYLRWRRPRSGRHGQAPMG